MEGKVVLITGSSNGTGAVTAEEYAKLGAMVVVTGRDKKRVESVCEVCTRVSPTNQKCFGFTCDLNNDNEVKSLVTAVIEKFGKLDVIVCFHGIGDTSDYDTEDLMNVYDKIMKINLRSVVYLCHLVIPHLQRSKGCIVLTSSFTALKPHPEEMVFSMAHICIDLYTRYLAVRLGPMGIRVNSIRPIGTITPSKETLFHKIGMSDAEISEFFEYYRNLIPLRQNVTSIDITNAVIYLTSEKASFISGINLNIDGAYSGL